MRTTIKVRPETNERIKELKITDRQSHDELLNLLMDGKLDEIQRLKKEIAQLTNKTQLHNSPIVYCSVNSSHIHTTNLLGVVA